MQNNLLKMYIRSNDPTSEKKAHQRCKHYRNQLVKNTNLNLKSEKLWKSNNH